MSGVRGKGSNEESESKESYSSQLPVTGCQLGCMSRLRSLTSKNVLPPADPVLDSTLTLVDLLGCVPSAEGVEQDSECLTSACVTQRNILLMRRRSEWRYVATRY